MSEWITVRFSFIHKMSVIATFNPQLYPSLEDAQTNLTRLQENLGRLSKVNMEILN